MRSNLHIAMSLVVVIALFFSKEANATTWYEYSMWHFDDATGVTVDSGPGRIDLTTMMGSPTQIAGYSGESVDLNPTATSQDGFGNATNTFNVNTAGIRISAMIRPNETSHAGSEVSPIVNRSGHFNLYLRSSLYYSGLYWPDYLVWDIIGERSTVSLVAEVYTMGLFDGDWHNVVATYDPNSHVATLEMDGVVLVTKACNVGTVGAVENPWIMIGTGASGQTGVGFDGAIDEVQLSTYVDLSYRTLIITSNPSSITSIEPAPGAHKYPVGTTVLINAMPFNKCPDIFNFQYWTGDFDISDPASNSSNIITTVVMDRDRSIEAVYELVDTACGDACHPIYPEDLHPDCMMDMQDIAVFIEKWLDCSAPECD